MWVSQECVIFLCFAFATVFCFGQELIKGETKFSLKRQSEENTEGSFWSLTDMKMILFGTQMTGNIFFPFCRTSLSSNALWD